MSVYFTELIRWDLRWRHLLTSSLLLLSRSSRVKMWNFSKRHNLHLLDAPLYECALSMIFHDISNSSCRSFRFHICLLSSVAVLKLLFLNDCLWPYKRLLKLPSVSPTYFFSSEFDLMVASYIIPSSRHFPSTGHVSFFLQLHDRFSSPSVSFLRSWLLWFLMALSMLGMHRGDTFSVFRLKISSADGHW